MKQSPQENNIVQIKQVVESIACYFSKTFIFICIHFKVSLKIIKAIFSADVAPNLTQYA